MTDRDSTSSISAVIMAGGRGSRLWPHTADIPKALVEIGHRPIIEIILRRFHKCGVRKVWLAIGHRADQIMQAVGDGSGYGLDIEYIVEDEPKGTVGALRLIKNLPENFLVSNCDVLSDIDLRTLYEFHAENDSLMTVATTQRDAMIDYGVINSDPERRIVGFTEKPSLSYQVSMGIYVFGRAVVEHIPSDRSFGFDQLLLRLLKAGLPVYSYPYDGYWLDIGKPEDYELAQQDAKMIMGWL